MHKCCREIISYFNLNSTIYTSTRIVCHAAAKPDLRAMGAWIWVIIVTTFLPLIMMMIKNSMWYKQLESITLDNSIACKTSAANRWMCLRVVACGANCKWYDECIHARATMLTNSMFGWRFLHCYLFTINGIFISHSSRRFFFGWIFDDYIRWILRRIILFFFDWLIAKRTMTRKMIQWHRVYDECRTIT